MSRSAEPRRQHHPVGQHGGQVAGQDRGRAAEPLGVVRQSRPTALPRQVHGRRTARRGAPWRRPSGRRGSVPWCAAAPAPRRPHDGAGRRRPRPPGAPSSRTPDAGACRRRRSGGRSRRRARWRRARRPRSRRGTHGGRREQGASMRSRRLGASTGRAAVTEPVSQGRRLDRRTIICRSDDPAHSLPAARRRDRRLHDRAVRRGRPRSRHRLRSGMLHLARVHPGTFSPPARSTR